MKAFVKGVVLFAALCVCAGYISSPSRAEVSGQKRRVRKGSDPIQPEGLARTRALFKEKCARCHGEDGRGETVTGAMLDVPDFTDVKWWKEGKSDRRLITSVTEGRDGMPHFGKKLSGQEIAALVAYVRRFGTAARQAGRASQP
jgi:mono/diheme cytochrome c family protein